jgi:hypothetical protein
MRALKNIDIAFIPMNLPDTILANSTEEFLRNDRDANFLVKNLAKNLALSKKSCIVPIPPASGFAAW